MQRYTVYL